jgi:hypothetical protein
LGKKGDEEIELDRFDVFSLSPGVYLCFRNIGDSRGMLMAIIGSKDTTGDGGRLDWAPGILK